MNAIKRLMTNWEQMYTIMSSKENLKYRALITQLEEPTMPIK